MESRIGGKDQEAIISDIVRFNGVPTTLTLTGDGELRWEDGGDRSLTVELEVLGFVAEGSGIRVRAFVEKESWWWCCGGRSRRIRAREDFVFEPLSVDSQRIWCEKLQEFIDSLGRPKRLFIFVNPFGGKKSALKIFHDEVKPLLVAANIQHTVQETQYQLHAKEVAHSLDLSKYDGIVCVSGDGVLVEVVNGLLQREDWESAIKVPLGIVSAGTGNGMAKSLLDSVDEDCSVSNSMLSIIRGHKRPLDVATIVQGETRFFSVLMLAWGLVADIDIESEKYRWLGSSRLDFYALVRLINLRKYNGRLSFVPAPGWEAYGKPNDEIQKCTGNLYTLGQTQVGPPKIQKHRYGGPNIRLEDMEWRTIDGPFISVWLHNVPWGSEDTLAAPDAQFSDGYLDLVVVKDCPKSSLIALMTKLNDGSHVKSPCVLYLKVRAFILEPGQRVGDPSKGGIIDCDGEVLAKGEGTYNSDKKDLMAYGPIQITVDQGLATLFAPR